MDKTDVRENFLFHFAYLWSVATISYLFLVTFVNIPDKNQRTVDTALGFLLGTIIAGLIGYFYGSSHGSTDKDATIKDVVEHELDSHDKPV